MQAVLTTETRLSSRLGQALVVVTHIQKPEENLMLIVSRIVASGIIVVIKTILLKIKKLNWLCKSKSSEIKHNWLLRKWCVWILTIAKKLIAVKNFFHQTLNLNQKRQYAVWLYKLKLFPSSFNWGKRFTCLGALIVGKPFHCNSFFATVSTELQYFFRKFLMFQKVFNGVCSLEINHFWKMAFLWSTKMKNHHSVFLNEASYNFGSDLDS